MVILRVEIDSDKDPKLFQAVSRLLTGNTYPAACPSIPSAGSWQPTIYGELAVKVFDLLTEGSWIQAIKQVRQDRGLYLKEAKLAVDSYREYLRNEGYLRTDQKKESEFRTDRAFRP